MASPSLNLVLSPPSVASSASSSLSSSQSPSPRCFQPVLTLRSPFSSALSSLCRGGMLQFRIYGRLRRRSHIVRMAPEEEKMTRRSPLDFPIEWERPKPGRRPDIFPQFSPMKTPLPPPLPADPPEEDEEEEEKKEEEEEDPEKEAEPDQPEKQ